MVAPQLSETWCNFILFHWIIENKLIYELHFSLNLMATTRKIILALYTGINKKMRNIN